MQTAPVKDAGQQARQAAAVAAGKGFAGSIETSPQGAPKAATAPKSLFGS